MAQILHASIPADAPDTVAATLARLLGGSAMPFPPAGPNAWIAWGDDGHTEIEIVPRGDRLTRGPQEAEWRTESSTPRRSEVHLAIAVARDAEDVLRIAAEAGWPARRCRRGDLFELIELWVEDAFLIELFDPDQAAHFARTISAQKWQAMLNAPPPHASPA